MDAGLEQSQNRAWTKLGEGWGRNRERIEDRLEALEVCNTTRLQEIPSQVVLLH